MINFMSIQTMVSNENVYSLLNLTVFIYKQQLGKRNRSCQRDNHSDQENIPLFNHVQTYIKNTERLDYISTLF